MPRFFPVLGALLLAVPAVAQDQSSGQAPSGNAVKNGVFAETYDAPNLWLGVDHDGFVAGPVSQVAALGDQGHMSDRVTMPLSVAVGDLNGDKLPDILTSDPLGYVRIYFNEGSATEPKFGAGELSLPFLARPDGEPPWEPDFGDKKFQVTDSSFGTDSNQWLYNWSRRRQAPRSSLSPGARGTLDLWVGNYFGDIIYFPNQGSPTAPVFAQPGDFRSALVPTSQDPAKRWGNIFAPVYADMNGDGRSELLIGEGSYSANNVHLLSNQGAPGQFLFDSSQRMPIALGEGREQLVPAVVDANGDGKLDVLVADRSGRIAVHLQPASWSPGTPFPFSGFLGRDGGLSGDFGQSLPVGEGITTLATGDLDGNGLFDLVVGRSNGRVAWARNTGSATEPKFGAPEELRSSASAPAISRMPEKWITDAGVNRGNFGGYVTVVSSSDDPSVGDRGRNVVRLGYQPLANKLVKRPDVVFPGVAKFDMTVDEAGMDNVFRLGTNWGDFIPEGATRRMRGAPSNAYLLRTKLESLAIGKTYVLAFDLRGSGVSKARVLLGWRASQKQGEDRLVRGERGAVERQRDVIGGQQIEQVDFPASGNWTTFSREFRIAFKQDPEANKLDVTSEAILEIYAELAPPDGVLYIDNVRFEPKP